MNCRRSSAHGQASADCEGAVPGSSSSCCNGRRGLATMRAAPAAWVLKLLAAAAWCGSGTHLYVYPPPSLHRSAGQASSGRRSADAICPPWPGCHMLHASPAAGHNICGWMVTIALRRGPTENKFNSPSTRSSRISGWSNLSSSPAVQGSTDPGGWSSARRAYPAACPHCKLEGHAICQPVRSPE